MERSQRPGCRLVAQGRAGEHAEAGDFAVSMSGRDLAASRVIVTGGSRGIGESLVRGLAAGGAHVASMDIRVSEGRRVAAEAEAEGPGHASFVECDIADREAVNLAFTEACEQLGGLDGLVNVAALARPSGAAERTSVEEMALFMNVNIAGTVNTNLAAFERLRETGGGRIINFSSSAGVVGMRRGAPYAASKGAVLAWTRSIAKEWGRYRITANAVCPSVETPAYFEMRASMSAESLAALDADYAANIPLGGKLGDPLRDVVPVVAFILSPASGFMTGQTFVVDGGRLVLT